MIAARHRAAVTTARPPELAVHGDEPVTTHLALLAAKQADAYLAGRDAKTPLASPLYADLAGLPPLLLQVGSAEVLLDDSVRVAERARKAGVEVDLRVWPDMFHVWHAFAQILPEGQQAVDEMAAFLEKRLA